MSSFIRHCLVFWCDILIYIKSKVFRDSAIIRYLHLYNQYAMVFVVMYIINFFFSCNLIYDQKSLKEFMVKIPHMFLSYISVLCQHLFQQTIAWNTKQIIQVSLLLKPPKDNEPISSLHKLLSARLLLQCSTPRRRRKEQHNFTRIT